MSNTKSTFVKPEFSKEGILEIRHEMKIFNPWGELLAGSIGGY